MASTFSYFITTTLEHNHSPDAAAIEVNCLHVLSFLMRMLYCVREIFHNCQLCLSLWMCIESYILNRKRACSIRSVIWPLLTYDSYHLIINRP